VIGISSAAVAQVGVGGGAGIPPEVIPIVQSFLFTVTVIILGYPLMRSISRRFIERTHEQPLAMPRELGVRLERIERAVDAIAIEVERVSESQRFLTRLQSERKSIEPGSGRPSST
jgi:hypothetical protein